MRLLRALSDELRLRDFWKKKFLFQPHLALNLKHLPTLHFPFSSSFICIYIYIYISFSFCNNIFLVSVALLQLLASKRNVVVVPPSLRHCVVLLEEGGSRASTFYHRACGYSTTLRCCTRKETHTPSMLLQCDVMLLQEDGDLCTSMLLEHGAFGVLLCRIEQDPRVALMDTCLCCCNVTLCWRRLLDQHQPPVLDSKPPRWRKCQNGSP